MMKKKVGFAGLLADARNSPEYKAERLALQFAAELERLMEEKSITRAQLAKKAGVSKAYITKLFSGEGNYTLETMVRFADAVGADLHQHLCDGGRRMRWLESIPGGRMTTAPAPLARKTVVSRMDENDDGLTSAA